MISNLRNFVSLREETTHLKASLRGVVRNTVLFKNAIKGSGASYVRMIVYTALYCMRWRFLPDEFAQTLIFPIKWTAVTILIRFWNIILFWQFLKAKHGFVLQSRTCGYNARRKYARFKPKSHRQYISCNNVALSLIVHSDKYVPNFMFQILQLIDQLIDYIVFYVVSVIFRPYNGGDY